MTTNGKSAAYVAAFAAAVMIAQQVAGKAARDALFLSHYAPNELPKVMVASAVLSLVGVLITSSAMQRFAPARVVPVAFLLSGLLFAGEWVLLPRNPGLAAWAIYLHMGVFGAIVISGFWSVVNERFDPHSAKKAVARIAAAATFGGLVGGLSAERVAVLLEPRAMLIALAIANGVCAVAMLRVGAPLRARVSGEHEMSFGAGLRILREVTYLQKLGALVLLVAMTAALLDFALKAQAAERLESGETLMQFFALFYTATGLVTFVVQSLFARRVLSRFGLDGSIALLPAVVLIAGVLGTVVTRMWTVVLVRGAESVLANSFFRSGYELLYTPLAPLRKRATKTIIDVGFDRIGDAAGSGVIFLVLWLVPGESIVAPVLAVATAVAAIALVISRTLHHGYVGTLAESLRSGALELSDDDVVDATTRRTLSETTLALDRERLLLEIAALRARGGRMDADVRQAMESDRPPPEETRADAEPDLVHQVELLASGKPERVRRALARRPLDPRLAPLAIHLLGNDALHRPAREALAEIAPRICGTLVDALLDPSESPAVRRRLPRILARVDSEVSAAGLFAALRDERFDVRYRCGQALAALCARRPDLAPTAEAVLTAAARELEVDREVFESQQHEDDEVDEPAWLDEAVRRHMIRSLEHVFTLLSLTLDREPLLLSLRALHGGDEGLRGTALEYLENVLPDEIHAQLLPYLSERTRSLSAPRRTREQIVDELLRSMDDVRRP